MNRNIDLLCGLGAIVALIIGVASNSIHRERVRADSCYVQYSWNQQTQQPYLAVNYCGGQREEEGGE